MDRQFGYARQLTDPGQVIAQATITIYNAGTLVLATIFDDDLLPVPTPKANPFLSDQYGFYYFYAVDGRYDVRVSGGTPAVGVPYTQGDVFFGTPQLKLPSYTLAALPAPDAARPGRIARVTDGIRGVWVDNGTRWVQQDGKRVNVQEFGAIGDGVTDDSDAIQNAIDHASHLAVVGTEGLSFIRSTVVWFPMPEECYRITKQITIPPSGRNVVIEGAGEGCYIKHTTAGAHFRLEAPGIHFRNIMLYGDGPNGAGVAAKGIVCDDPITAGEVVLSGVTIYNFTDCCLEIVNGSIARLLGHTRLACAPTLLRLINTSAVSIQAANFFQLEGSIAAIEVRGFCVSIAFQGSWAEGFKDFLVIDNANGGVTTSFYATGSHFTSVRANNRLVKVKATQGGLVACLALAVSFRDSTLNLLKPDFITASDYTVEVDCSGNDNTNFNLRLDNVFFVLPPAIAVVLSDTIQTRVIFADIIGCPASKYLSGLGTKLGVSGGGPFTYGADMFLPGGLLRWPTVPVPVSDVNTLDHYQRGDTGTLVLTGTGGASGVTYQGRFALFVRDGRRVTVGFSVLVLDPGTIVGNVLITLTGMPIAHAIGEISVCQILFKNLATNWVNVIGVMDEGTNNLHLRGCPAPTAFPYSTLSGNDVPLVDADIAIGTHFRGTITYYIDET